MKRLPQHKFKSSMVQHLYELTLKRCNVVHQNHLEKVISIQHNDIDLSRAAALTDLGWSKVIKCNEQPREKIPWNCLDPPSTIMFTNVPDSLHGENIPWNGLEQPKTNCFRLVRKLDLFFRSIETPIASHCYSFDLDTRKVNWNGLGLPRVAMAFDRGQLQF